MSVPDTARHNARKVVIEEYPILGYNHRLTDLQAAVGLEQMKRVDGLVRRRVEVATRYNRKLSDYHDLQTPYAPPCAEPNFQSYAVALKDDCHIGRDELWQTLLDAGVSAKRGVMAIHRERSYTETYGRQSLPLTEKASDSSLLLPLFPQMTPAEQDHVIATLGRALKS